MFSEDFETDFGLKQNGGVMGAIGSKGGVVGNLLEKYWFLDSFGADLGEIDGAWRMITVGVPILGRFSFI